jgi:lambda family phage portal protein
VQGAFTVFVTKPPIENGPPPLSGTTDTSAQVPAGAQQGNETGLDYGAMVELREGEQVSFADPGRPNAAFDPFVQAIWTQIGMALELPKEVLTKAFLSSYSAARASLLEAWRFFRKRREWVAAGFCQPVYEAVITEAVLSGRLRAPGFVRDPLVRAAYLRAVWIGDAPGAIDPLKEAKASTERMNNGTSDRSAETIAYSGRNWEDVHAQRVRERRAEERDGIAPPAPAATPPQPTDTPDENEEAEQ